MLFGIELLKRSLVDGADWGKNVVKIYKLYPALGIEPPQELLLEQKDLETQLLGYGPHALITALEIISQIMVIPRIEPAEKLRMAVNELDRNSFNIILETAQLQWAAYGAILGALSTLARPDQAFTNNK